MKDSTEKKINYSAVNKKYNGSFDTLITTYILKNLDGEKISFKNFIKEIEIRIILTALRLTGGNQRKAASLLGIRATTLNEKYKRYELDKSNLYMDPAVILNEKNSDLLKKTPGKLDVKFI